MGSSPVTLPPDAVAVNSLPPDAVPLQPGQTFPGDYSPDMAANDAKNFLSSAANAAWGAIKSPFTAFSDLSTSAQRGKELKQEGLAAQQPGATQQQKDAYHQHLLQALPFVGSPAAKVAQGNYAGAAGDVVGGLAGGAVLGGALGAAGAAVDKFNPANVDPDTALWQAVPMRTSAADYLDMGPTVRGDIKAAAVSRNSVPGGPAGMQAASKTNPIVDVPSAKQAVGAAKAINRAVLDMHLDPYRRAGYQLPGAPIAQAIDDTIPMSTQIEAKWDQNTGDPLNEQARQIQTVRQIAEAYRHHNFSVDELRQLAVETNGDLNAFYHKTADAQNAAIAQQGGTAVLEAKAQAIRDMMRNTFGPDVADIQRRWGYLDDVDAGLDAAYKRVLSQKPLSTADQAINLPTAPGKAAKQFVHGDINTMLRRAFDQTEPSAPLPTPQGAQGVGGMPGQAPPNRQLPPATPQLGQPMGSYVSTSGAPPAWQVNQWQNIGGQRALPAPSPGEPPLNILPRGPAGTARPLPPAGTSAILDQPGRPLGLPEPPAPRPRGRFVVPASEAFRAGAGQLQDIPASPAGTQYHPTSENIASQMGKSIWNALYGGNK